MGVRRARCDVEEVLVQLQTLLPIILLVGVFYLLILRPARTRQKAQQETLGALAVGKEVMTTGGLFGTVTAITDDRVELEIADGVRVQYLQAAVSRVVPDPAAETDEPAADVIDDADNDDDDDDPELTPTDTVQLSKDPADAMSKDPAGGDTHTR